MNTPIDLTDNGYASKKMVMAYVSMILIFGGAVLAANWASFLPLYSTMIGGILASASIYTGSEVGTHFINHKHVVAMKQASKDDDEADEAEDPPLGPSRKIQEA